MQQPPISGGGGAGEELRSDAKQLSKTAANRLHSEVDARKSSAASQAKSVSTAIQRTVSEMNDDAPRWLKSAFQQGAEQIQRFADAIDQTNSRQLVSETQDFARRSPGAFLAACTAAGFAAARIFKAGAEQPQANDQARGPGQEFEGGQQFEPSSGESILHSPEPDIGMAQGSSRRDFA